VSIGRGEGGPLGLRPQRLGFRARRPRGSADREGRAAGQQEEKHRRGREATKVRGHLSPSRIAFRYARR